MGKLIPAGFRGSIEYLRDFARKSWRDPAGSRAFRCLVFNLFLERFPHGFIPDKTLFIGFHLAGNDIARFTFRNLGSLFLLLAHKSPVYVNNVAIHPGQSSRDSLVPAHPGSITPSRPWSIPITGKKAHYSFLYIEHCFVWDICSVPRSLAQSTTLSENNDSVAWSKYRQSSQASLANLLGRRNKCSNQLELKTGKYCRKLVCDLSHKLTVLPAKASPYEGLGINCQEDFSRNIAQI